MHLSLVSRRTQHHQSEAGLKSSSAVGPRRPLSPLTSEPRFVTLYYITTLGTVPHGSSLGVFFSAACKKSAEITAKLRERKYRVIPSLSDHRCFIQRCVRLPNVAVAKEYRHEPWSKNLSRNGCGAVKASGKSRRSETGRILGGRQAKERKLYPRWAKETTCMRGTRELFIACNPLG